MRPQPFGPFGYPVTGEGRERPLVACWVLVLVALFAPVLALAALVPLVGYLTRVLDATVRGESAPLLATDLRDLLVSGSVGLLVTVGYLIVPVLALLVTVYGAMTTVEGPTMTTVEQLVFYGGSTAVLTLFLLATYVVPAALALYGDEHSIRTAFSAGALRPVVGHSAYFLRWMTGTVTVGFAVAVGRITVQIHRVGPVVTALVVAYGLLVGTHVWGLGVRRAN